jgi:TM2 domain-containing membrane protein YozV
MSETTPPLIPPTPSGSTLSSAGQNAPSTKDLLRFEAEKKSAGLAFVLCWLLGVWGAHRFYLGRPHAVTMLIITLVSIPLCFILIGFVSLTAVWVWMIVDLFSVSGWVKEHNTALLGRIVSGQG